MKKQFIYIATLMISGMFSAQINIDEMPKPGATPQINIAKPQSFQLKNGLTVMVVENNKLPRVNATLSIDRPPVYEGNIVGVGEIMSSQLGNGTATMSKDEFNKKVDFLGANLNFSANGAFANTLSKYFPEVLGLMADAISNPKFDEKEIQDEKDRTIEALKIDEKSAESIADRVSQALAYGKNTSRGEFVTEASINKITLADVQNFYGKYYSPENAYLVIVGDVKFNDAKSLVEKHFNTWKKSGTQFFSLESAVNVSKTEINIVDVPDAVQSVINVGNLTNLKMNDPKYFAASITNYILGGGADSRLFMNLREKNGFTYGAYSSISSDKYSPKFTSGASVRNEVTAKAVTEFMNELKAIENITDEELANAKAKLEGTFIMSLEKPETIAKFAVDQKVKNLPENFYTDYLKSIDKVSKADVSAAAKAYILPNQSRIFVAGKSSEIGEELEKLGYPVKYFDKEANPVAKPVAQKIDASVSVTSVAEKYINAIGGKAAVNKITSYAASGSMQIQGMNIDVKMIRATGGKEVQMMQMMGQTMGKDVFDGISGYSEGMGQREEMDADDIAKRTFNKELFEELAFNDTDYKLGGIEKINDEDSYAVVSKYKTYYYSVETGLKTGESSTEKGPQGDMRIPVYYSDYQEVSGVKFPFAITISQMGMEMQIKINSYDVNNAKDEDFK